MLLERPRLEFVELAALQNNTPVSTSLSLTAVTRVISAATDNKAKYFLTMKIFQTLAVAAATVFGVASAGGSVTEVSFF